MVQVVELVAVHQQLKALVILPLQVLLKELMEVHLVIVQVLLTIKQVEVEAVLVPLVQMVVMQEEPVEMGPPQQ